MQHINSMLCLGDSYTIGEGVPIHENFPYQLVQQLRNKGLLFYAPEIVAKTGFTSSELATHVLHHKYNAYYNYVTLLIGVNNQYRKQNINDYKIDFDFLLQKSLHYANNNPQHVFVLSIPDWGVTPFALNHNPQQIAKEIDEYNNVNKISSQIAGVHYIDITESSRLAKNNTQLLTTDGLHYSALEYANWATEIAKYF